MRTSQEGRRAGRRRNGLSDRSGRAPHAAWGAAKVGGSGSSGNGVRTRLAPRPSRLSCQLLDQELGDRPPPRDRRLCARGTVAALLVDDVRDLHAARTQRLDHLVAFGLHHARIVSALVDQQRRAQVLDVRDGGALHQQRVIVLRVADEVAHHRPPVRRNAAREGDQVRRAHRRRGSSPSVREPRDGREGGETAEGRTPDAQT